MHLHSSKIYAVIQDAKVDYCSIESIDNRRAFSQSGSSPGAWGRAAGRMERCWRASHEPAHERGGAQEVLRLCSGDVMMQAEPGGVWLREARTRQLQHFATWRHRLCPKKVVAYTSLGWRQLMAVSIIRTASSPATPKRVPKS